MRSKFTFGFWRFAMIGTLFAGVGTFGSSSEAAAQAPAAQAPPRTQAPPRSGGPGRPGNRPGRPTNGRPGQPTIQPVPGPRPNPGRPTNGRPGYRPPRPGPGRPPGPPPPYAWRPGDRDRMRHYYRRNFGYINRGRRPIFTIGGFIPFGDRGYFRPLPPGVVGYMPPPPPGYIAGYFDGYVVVYDPISFTVLSVMDLLD
jgi:hypothetical protein